VKVDGSGEHLELEGAFRRDGENPSDSRPSVLAADDEVHPGGDGEARTGIPRASPQATVVSHALEVDPEVIVHGGSPVSFSASRASSVRP
jgi:hypothetical protein